MRLTILGKSPAWQDAGGACSGYLVSDGETNVLLDCGNGVFARLREHLPDYASLDAVVITHIHGDHMLDLPSFAYALRFSPAAAGRRPRLLLPQGGAEKLRQLTGVSGDPSLLDEAFAVEAIDPAAGAQIGTLSLAFAEVPHYVYTLAIDVRDGSGARFTYGADCALNDALAELATGTPLLVAEGTLLEPEDVADRAPGHMTPAQAGEQARRAGAARLLVTHISDERDLEAAAAAASEAFGGPAEIARADSVIEF